MQVSNELLKLPKLHNNICMSVCVFVCVCKLDRVYEYNRYSISTHWR